MDIQVFPAGPAATNAILCACTRTKQAALFDPAHGSGVLIIKHLSDKAYALNGIYLTHSHWDHIADIFALREKFPHVPVFVHKADAGNLQEPGSDGLPCPLTIPPIEPTGYLEEGSEFDLGDVRWHVMHTPGHTPGGVCFYAKEEGVLISGDTLFKGSIGNLSFPTAQPERMWPSLKRLAQLPSNTRVIPGHGEETTIGQEAWLERAEQKFKNFYSA